MKDTPQAGRSVGILTYDYDPPIGGLGVLVRTYVQELRKQYPQDTYTVISPSENADDHGSPFGRARYRKSGGCPMFSISLLWELPYLVKKHHLQILHVHAGSGGVFFLRRPKCKLVVTAHHTYRQEADYVYGRTVLKKLWKLLMAVFESRTYKIADAVICVSKDTAQEVIARYGIPAKKVSVVENAVQVKNHAELKVLPKAKNTIVFVGRLEPRKGILMLLKAFQILHKHMPDVKLRLIGFNMMGPSLQEIIGKRGLTSSVTALGFVHEPYRMRETAQATLLVVPSTLEGFGLVAAEAMMVGTAVVASNAPGLRSTVTDGTTGLLFTTNDAQACAECMMKVLRDDTLRATLEKNGAAEAPVRFDIVKRTQDQSDIYDRMLS